MKEKIYLKSIHILKKQFKTIHEFLDFLDWILALIAKLYNKVHIRIRKRIIEDSGRRFLRRACMKRLMIVDKAIEGPQHLALNSL